MRGKAKKKPSALKGLPWDYPRNGFNTDQEDRNIHDQHMCSSGVEINAWTDGARH